MNSNRPLKFKVQSVPANSSQASNKEKHNNKYRENEKGHFPKCRVFFVIDKNLGGVE